MFRKLLVVAACSAITASAWAVDASKVEKSIELADGSTVYLFKDGKMGMEDKAGRVTRMAPGHVMEGKDGKKYIMVGDEVARLESVLRGDDRKK